MWTWKLSWGAIREDLIVGSCPRSPSDIERIARDSGATALLSLQTAADHAELDIDPAPIATAAQRCGLVLARSPMTDFDAADQRAHLPAAVRTLKRLIDDGHRVYVHCTAGINRSTLVVLGYLAFVECVPAAAALRQIRRGRPVADPYWEVYLACRGDLVTRLGPSIDAHAAALLRADPSIEQARCRQLAEDEAIRRFFR